MFYGYVKIYISGKEVNRYIATALYCTDIYIFMYLHIDSYIVIGVQIQLDIRT